MPASDASGPTVALSYANNFWGKDDAGVGPLVERMQSAKATCDELRNFYAVRAAIEEEYAKKLLSLARKPFGSRESGSLKSSMDVLRSEVEGSGKAHQSIAQQMKSELEEPLAAFAGAMRERRKLVQGTVEKVLKLKISQTQAVNKTRDKFEQDCLRIKGYLAQGHMVMGQEEKKNKAKLEKTQIALANSNADYEAAIKALEETTVRWNKVWHEACDSFQDLDEERIDFLKTSLWTFANIASTACVSDDAAYEKVRLSLEECEVEKDITIFIKDKGTGQEIPAAPKYINFRRGDLSDDGMSDAGEDGYSVAQFPRAGNPIYRSSSPNPSTHSRSTENTDEEENSSRRKALDAETMSTRSQTTIRSLRAKSQKASSPGRPPSSHADTDYSTATSTSTGSELTPQSTKESHAMAKQGQEEEKQEKKKGFFANSPFRRKSKSEKLEKEQQKMLMQMQHHHRHQQQQQQQQQPQPQPPQQQQQQKQHRQYQPLSQTQPKHTTLMGAPASRRTWGPETATNYTTQGRQPQPLEATRRPSPEPIDPRATFQLNVGENVFDVAAPDARTDSRQGQPVPQEVHQQEEDDLAMDPIAQALAELKGVPNNSNTRKPVDIGNDNNTRMPIDIANDGNARKPVDRYYGIATPAPSSTPGPRDSIAVAAKRGTPPPTYTQPKRSALDLPAPAFTSAQMQQTTQRYKNQAEYMLEGPPQMPAAMQEGAMSRTGSNRSLRDRANTIDYHRAPSRQTIRDGPHDQQQMVRANSPNSNQMRSVSPRPAFYGESHRFNNNSPRGSIDYHRTSSPNPSFHQQPSPQTRPGTAHTMGNRNGGPEYFGNQQVQNVQQQNMRRTPSPNPMTSQDVSSYRPYSPNPQALVQQRPRSQHSGSFVDAHSGAMTTYNGQGQGSRGRPMSYYGDGYGDSNGQLVRPRSKSVVDISRSRFSRDGRLILHHARAMYAYTAAIPEELSFNKGDIMAILRTQDDGWWEAELIGQMAGPGLVPSNYLQVQQ